jgi:hypothetical protein
MAPVTVLVVEKSGSIKELPLKNYDESELYKKAGHKSNDGFKVYAQWNIEDLNDKAYSIYVYGKITGRANQENKFEFPPPIDTTLFFGNCLIVNKNEDDEVVSITEEEWETIYDYLYGGFEDLGDEDSEDEEDEDDGLPRTKEGYVKDDFIVDDDEDEDEEEEEEEEEEDEEEEEEEYVKKSKKQKAKPQPKSKAKTTDKKSKKVENVFISVTEQQENFLDCTSELSEEEYV